MKFSPDQNFRNFFRLKNISRETFETYLEYITQTSYNCQKEKMPYSRELFENFYKNSLYWQMEKLTDFQKEKYALCDAIWNI